MRIARRMWEHYSLRRGNVSEIRRCQIEIQSCLCILFFQKNYIKKHRQYWDHTSQNGNINSRLPLRVLLLFCATPLAWHWPDFPRIRCRWCRLPRFLALSVRGWDDTFFVFLWHSLFALLVGRAALGDWCAMNASAVNPWIISRFAPRLPRRSCNFELSMRGVRLHCLSALMIQSETAETLDSQENAQISATRPQAFIFTNCTMVLGELTQGSSHSGQIGEVLEVAYLHASD